MRTPIRLTVPDCGCASAASGAARNTAPVPARNVRRSITGSPRSIEPPSLPKTGLLSQERRDVLPNLAPCFGRPRQGTQIPERHRDLEPRQVAGGLRAGCETIRGLVRQVHAGALLTGWGESSRGSHAPGRPGRMALSVMQGTESRVPVPD